MKRRALATSQTIEFLPHRCYLVVLRDAGLNRIGLSTSNTVQDPVILSRCLSSVVGNAPFICLEDLIPIDSINLSQTIRFCCHLSDWMRQYAIGVPSYEQQSDLHEHQKHPHRVFFYIRRQHARLTQEMHAMQLLCCWRMLVLRLSPEEAMASFQHWCAGPPFSNHEIDLLALLRGVQKAFALSLLPMMTHATGTNPLEALIHLNRHVEMDGGLTWIAKKLLVISGPQDPASRNSSSRSLETDPAPPPQPEDVDANAMSTDQILPVLKQQHVALVIRLCSAQYDERKLSEVGIDCFDLACDRVDETTISRFLEACEMTQGVIAVHSTSSLGRAVTCIGCYLMKHYQFSALEAIHWIRLCRPRSLTHAQCVFLQRMQRKMWAEGNEYKRLCDSGMSSKPTQANASSSRSLQISIGNIALGGDSFLGTKEKKSMTPLPSLVTDHLCSPTNGISSSALHAARRRPLTQGSRRPHRLSEFSNREGGGSLRGELDFAAMRKFLHQPNDNSPLLNDTIERTTSDRRHGRPVTTAPESSSSHFS